MNSNGIAKVLSKARSLRVEAGTYSTGNAIMLDMIIEVFAEELAKLEAGFKPSQFKKLAVKD